MATAVLAKRRGSQNHAPLWEEYKKRGGLELRNRLIEAYLPLVRHIAERIHGKLPRSVDVEDLAAMGIFGLMDAIDGFDMSRGVKFETYCFSRVWGAILDELRLQDWVPRLVRARGHKMERVRSELEVKLGRPPKDEEMARKMGISVTELERYRKESKTAAIFSFGTYSSEDGEWDDINRFDLMEDDRTIDPIHMLMKEEVRRRMEESLSESEQMVALLYYFEGLTMKEIGRVLEVSESRVSQIHAQLLERLRYEFRSLQQAVS